MNIVFDLDGVIRDLHKYLEDNFKDITFENYKVSYNGKDIYQLIEDDNYLALINSPVTKYFSEIIKYKNIIIWTHQPEEWRSHTELWIKEYIGDCSILYLTPEEKISLLDLNKDIYLIEDSPNLSSYERIILIDKPYNQKVNCKIRIKRPGELNEYIQRVS